MADTETLADIKRDDIEQDDGVVGRIRDESAATAASSTDEPSGRRKRSKRITLHLVDGGIDFSRTPEPQLKQLSEAIASTPEASKTLALPKPQPKVELSVELCSMIVDALNSVEQLFAVLFLQVPREVSSKALVITDEQRDILVPPIKKVGEKYIPAKLMEYSPEAELAGAILTVGKQHYLTLSEMMQHYHPAQQPTNSHDTGETSVTV